MAKPATAAKAPSFGALLDKAPSEVERPKPLPQGSYITVLQGLPRQDKSAKKQTEFYEFTHKLLSAGEDVDEDELKAMGGVADKTIKNTYYITEGSLWRLKDFLGHFGRGVVIEINGLHFFIPCEREAAVGNLCPLQQKFLWKQIL